MTHVFPLEHIVEKIVLQNRINYDDAILSCNLLDLINVSGEMEVIFYGNEENATVTNRDTLKVNFDMHKAQSIKRPKIIQRSLKVRKQRKPQLET